MGCQREAVVATLTECKLIGGNTGLEKTALDLFVFSKYAAEQAMKADEIAGLTRL